MQVLLKSEFECIDMCLCCIQPFQITTSTTCLAIASFNDQLIVSFTPIQAPISVIKMKLNEIKK